MLKNCYCLRRRATQLIHVGWQRQSDMQPWFIASYCLILVVNWHLSKQGILLPVSHDHITGSSLELIEGDFFYFYSYVYFLWITLHTRLIYNTTLVCLPTQFTTIIQLQITAEITIYNGNTTTYTTYTTQQYDAIIDATYNTTIFINYSLKQYNYLPYFLE